VLTETPKILEKAPTLAAAVDVPPRALLPTNIEPNGANLALLPALASLFLYCGILVAAEHHKQKAAGTSTNVEQKVTVLHVGGKAGAIKWDVAQYKNKDAAAGSNAKFAPLGSMLVGVRARGVTATAAAAVGEFSKILGVSVSTKMAGNTIKAIYTKNTKGTVD
jgi:hypothetical protein